MKNSRRAAAFIIVRWLMTKEFPSQMLPEDGPDRSFVQDLVYTTIRRFRPLGTVLRQLVRKWPKGELEALLYVGAAQILYMPSVPEFAAVNETVEAAKEHQNPNVAKVVNGVLRNVVRRRDELLALVGNAPLDLEVLHESSSGRLKTLVVRGDAQEIAEKVKATQPAYFDVLPLSLEEIFIYELGGVNYEVKNIVL